MNAMKSFGENERGPDFQPIESGPHGEGGGFKGLVDVGDVEGDLNDRFYK